MGPCINFLVIIMVKKVFKISIISIISIFFLHLIAIPIVYNSIMSGNNKKSPSQSFDNLLGYDYEEVSFKNKNYKQYGYYFNNSLSDDLIIISNPIGYDSTIMIPVMKYFYDNNYDVFLFDNIGVGRSSGEIGGFLRGRLSLLNALNYINDSDYIINNKYLFGFSWGAYSVCSVLNDDIAKDIDKVIAISGFNDPYEIMKTKGKEYVSFLCDIGYPIMKCVMNSIHNGEKFVTAIDGINDTNIPIYIGHGDKDKTIRIDVESIYCQRDKINNLNVEYHIFEGKEHLKLIYNDELYSAINEELFQDILNFVKK